ncbi:coiled-coil domain-containing protein 93-like isoform X2 [Anopheles albimanus]|uniref:coiled-coil domain-containing protein 93-like isoform X2 n=1 Tax=Anopheles albimanus TaxID=7167 RepID=UPI0016422E9E|nr:coiled-coil domain-containing protein 93-like isoform X2 [Anopheles albimanus]
MGCAHRLLSVSAATLYRQVTLLTSQPIVYCCCCCCCCLGRIQLLAGVCCEQARSASTRDVQDERLISRWPVWVPLEMDPQSHSSDAKAQPTDFEAKYEMTQKQLEDSLKDNENLVMKYAYVEKKNIDLRALVEEKEGEIKRRDRELAQLQKQVATLRAEQQPRHRKYADAKHTPPGADERQTAEQIAELKAKIMELQAIEIMLKHANIEQTERIRALQKSNEELRASLEHQEAERNSCLRTLKEMEDGRQQLNGRIKQMADEHEAQSSRIAELNARLQEAHTAAQESARMQHTIEQQAHEREQLQQALDEQRHECETVKQRELELLTLNKDLSELNCVLQQEIAKQESNMLAVTLEYGKFIKMFYDYDAQIVSLANSLAIERQLRAEERLLMAKHIADKARKLTHTEQCLRQTRHDLEAYRKKYGAIVKEFQREVKNVQQLVGQ